MKLYLAMSGENRLDILANLLLAANTPETFTNNNAFTEDFQIDYKWIDEEGRACLVDIKGEF